LPAVHARITGALFLLCRCRCTPLLLRTRAALRAAAPPRRPSARAARRAIRRAAQPAAYARLRHCARTLITLRARALARSLTLALFFAPPAQLGSTAIGIRTSEGVVLAVEKRITSPLLARPPFLLHTRTHTHAPQP
jgi:hypothetical protein